LCVWWMWDCVCGACEIVCVVHMRLCVWWMWDCVSGAREIVCVVHVSEWKATMFINWIELQNILYGFFWEFFIQ